MTEITRKTVADLADKLKGKKKPGDEGRKSDEPGNTGGDDVLSKFGHDQIQERTREAQDDGIAIDENDENGRDTGDLVAWSKDRALSDPDRISKPLLLVEFEGRSAAVLLNRRPSSAGLIHIRFEDGGDQEVDAGVCKINLLTQAEK